MRKIRSLTTVSDCMFCEWIDYGSSERRVECEWIKLESIGFYQENSTRNITHAMHRKFAKFLEKLD